MIKRRSFVAAAASFLLTATVLFVPGASASPSTIFGFNSYVSAQTIADQKQLGDVRVRRMFVYWDRVEQIPGRWDWSKADQEYRAVVDAGLQPLIVAQNSPAWARPGRSGSQGPPDTAFDSNWTQFVRALAQRYPAAIAIEIWNEPNLPLFFSPVDPARYTQLLTKAYHTVKAVRPSLPVISAGLAGYPGTKADSTGWAVQPFLDAMFKAGAEPAMDGIGVHIYPTVADSNGVYRWNPAGFGQMLDVVRAARERAGASQPIWVTEVGESTETAWGWPAAVSPEQQAADLITMIDAAKADVDVAAMMLHTVSDTPALWHAVYGEGGLNGFGAFASTNSFSEATQPKPAACAISQKFGGSLRC
jgi:hypothetical protein